MTDITELAQSLKNAASKALIEEGLTWFSEEQLSHEDGIAIHKADAEFIALANPADVLALVEALEKAQQRIAELESRTVKLPDGWQFEECEIEGCENGAIFSVGTGSRNIHLCDKCAHGPQNSRLKKSPLSKRLPFKMSAGIKVEAE
ncbi:TPA: ead/Ea22-like family protein [Klebsiella pneumoniae]|uniref:ead/Ea22-like family protein n=1 Tax=Klebsiella pneumoniae TaxID=573 RepID=UPI0007CBA775|nr:ead/Ea22-like family protein [Klebsiella pneumoniae]QBI25956.1 ead/Ea22-like family protein [Klebsiella pneumoniae]SAX03526.1 Ead domain protein [Klebsiella pneumoniae]HCJ1363452.1 ead/Ea22-like family protein [Klebsiella pneumoniae]HCJ2062029.1 ead/Ea22-like family protein [Klebsiella pneumoniae]